MSDARRESRRLFIQRSALLVGAGFVLRGCETAPSAKRPLPSPLLFDGSAATLASAGDAGAAPSGPYMPDLTPPATEPVVRVRLARLERSSRPIEIGAAGKDKWLQVVALEGDQPVGVERLCAAPLSIVSEPGGWTVTDAERRRVALTGSELRIESARPASAEGLTFSGGSYPGAIRLVAGARDGSEQVDVVNDVALESYLPGVLARELYADWHFETYAAQSVAARSFACSEIAYWRGRRSYDVVAGQASQAYIGTTTRAVARNAVTATRGTLLLWNGKVVPAYYSSCCGGASASALDGISPHPMHAIAPLEARPPRDCCRTAPVWRWTSAQESAEMATRLMAWGKSRGDASVRSLAMVVSVEPVAVAANGRPTRYAVTDESGAIVTVGAEQLRWGLNYSGPGITAPKKPVRSGHFTVTRSGRTLNVDGRGYGHGVGLCQYGAESAARSGAAWQLIVKRDYPGATLGRCYA